MGSYISYIIDGIWEAKQCIWNNFMASLESYFVFAEKKKWREAEKIWI